MIFVLSALAIAGDRTEFTCSPRCSVVIGKERGPETSIRYTKPIVLRDANSQFEVTDNWGDRWDLTFAKDARPIWVQMDAEGERVWYGLQKGPIFNKIDSASLGHIDEIAVHEFDGTEWHDVIWDAKRDELIFDNDHVHMRDDPVIVTHPPMSP